MHQDPISQPQEPEPGENGQSMGKSSQKSFAFQSEEDLLSNFEYKKSDVKYYTIVGKQQGGFLLERLPPAPEWGEYGLGSISFYLSAHDAGE